MCRQQEVHQKSTHPDREHLRHPQELRQPIRNRQQPRARRLLGARRRGTPTIPNGDGDTDLGGWACKIRRGTCHFFSIKILHLSSRRTPSQGPSRLQFTQETPKQKIHARLQGPNLGGRRRGTRKGLHEGARRSVPRRRQITRRKSNDATRGRYQHHRLLRQQSRTR